MYSQYETLTTDYKEIYNYVVSEYKELSSEIMERISKLNVYSARTSKMIAEAEYILNVGIQEIMKSEKMKEFSPSIQKKFIDSETRNEQYLYTCIERLNASITHQLDALRSQLSFIKTEMGSVYSQT